jgi:hypothetical protein
VKILISPGLGTGWSTQARKTRQKKEIAEYAPIIDFLEAGGEPEGADFDALVDRMEEALSLGHFNRGGAEGLRVQEVSGPYFIEVYDGSETIRISADFW